MMRIDSLNLIFTMMSIVVTLISIGCSIWAFISAKKSEHYKNEALQLVGSFGLEGLLSKFRIESRYFLNNTRSKDWYKGKDINPIISPLKDVLSSFGKFYPLINDSNSLKDKVHELDDILHVYSDATQVRQQRVNNLILEIIEILEAAIHNNTQKIIRQ